MVALLVLSLRHLLLLLSESTLSFFHQIMDSGVCV